LAPIQHLFLSVMPSHADKTLHEVAE
jgi:hypothetical protein